MISEADRTFEDHRRRLFGIAYGMLGQVMDAEDVVQDAYLRWRSIDHAKIQSPAAYLTTIVTRLAIDRLRSAHHRREEYVGPWLPEPLVPPDPAGDVGDVVERAEALSLAFVAALERLNPVERAVLLLRDVFDFDYAEIAEVVDRTEANCRQIAVRARNRAARPGRAHRPDPQREQELVAAFLAAMAAGRLDQLTGVLAADVALWSDGGGQVRAARHPIYGVDKVARFLLGVRKNARPGDTYAYTRANGEPAVLVARKGEPFAVMVFEVANEGITGLRTIMNPDKLGHLRGVPAPLPLVLE